MARSLWICPRGRSCGRGEIRKRLRRPLEKDRQEKGTGGGRREGDGWRKEGKLRGGDVPADALAHLPCGHRKEKTIRVGLKNVVFFVPMPCALEAQMVIKAFGS